MRNLPIMYPAGIVLSVLLAAQATFADIAADLKQAEELCKAAQYARAEQIYQSIISKADSNKPEEAELAFNARRKLPLIYIATDRQPQARAAVEQLLARHGEHERLPHALHELVEQAKALGKTEQARQLYWDTLAARPDHPQAIWLKMGIAIAHAHLGNDETVDAALKDIITRHGGEPWAAEALAQTAWAYDKLKQYKKARLIYDYVVDNWADRPRAVYAHTALVRSCICLRDKEAASARLAQLVQRYAQHNDLPNVLTQIGRGYREAAMYEEAKQVSQYVLNHHPNTGYGIWAQRDVVLSDIGLRAEEAARIQLGQLVARYAEDEHLPYVLNEIAGGYRQVRSYEQAMNVSQHVLHNHPDSEHCLWAQRDVVLSQLDLGDLEGAAAGTKVLLSRFAKQPGAIWAISEVAETYSRLGRHEQARELFTFNLAHCPDPDDNIWSLRGFVNESVALNDEPSIDAGIKKLFSAYSGSKNLPMAAIHLGRELCKAGHTRAPELFQYVIDKHPDHEQAIFAKVCTGHVHIRQGQDSRAEAIYQKVLTDYKGHPKLAEAVQVMAEGYWNLGLAEERNGLIKQARLHCAKALEKWQIILLKLPQEPYTTGAAHHFTAQYYAHAGEYDKAIEHYQALSQCHAYPYSRRARSIMGLLTRRRDNPPPQPPSGLGATPVTPMDGRFQKGGEQ